MSDSLFYLINILCLDDVWCLGEEDGAVASSLSQAPSLRISLLSLCVMMIVMMMMAQWPHHYLRISLLSLCVMMIVMMMMAQWPHHYLRITEITLLRSHYFSLCQCQVAAPARIQIQRTRPPALETEYYLHNFIAAKMLYTNFLWLARMIDGVLREREITI